MTMHILETAAQESADMASVPPFPYELGPEGARKVLGELQADPVETPDVEDKWVTVPADVGDVPVRIVKPFGSRGTLPVVLYLHGGGWVIGDAGTHDRLVRELAVGTHAAVAFVEYDRAPEAKYPVAIEQLYCPVIDAAQNTESYREFADGPYLTAKAMAWFWDCYTTDPAQRAEITASPLRASLEQLRGLPPALVIVDDSDVLRDEGEAYARRLTQADVPTTSIRINGALHDFMMLNPLRTTRSATAAMEQAVHTLRTALHDH